MLPMNYLLLDTNVVAAYYLPRSHASKKASERIQIIMDSVRSGGTSELFLYIPNLCIAETFGVFAKHTFGKWNNQVKKTLDTRVYRSLKNQFREDIHNGNLLYQYELNRYHILATELVAPIDHHYQHTRNSGMKSDGSKRKKNHNPMRTMDHLILGMGIHLAHVHGRDNVHVVTADNRLADILQRCRRGLPSGTPERLKMDIAKEITGKSFGPDLFPDPLNLKSATKAQLTTALGSWPLRVEGKPKAYRWLD